MWPILKFWYAIISFEFGMQIENDKYYVHAWYTIHEGDVFSHVATLNLGKQLI